MGSIVEFVLSLRDINTLATLRTVSRNATGAQRNITAIGAAARSAGTVGTNSINGLNRSLNTLERRRRLHIDTSAVQAAQGKVQGLNNGSNIAGFVKGGIMAKLGTDIISMAAGSISSAYDAGIKSRGMENAINVTTKGQGTEAIAQTDNIVNKYGLNYSASLEGVKTLTGGLMGMNMTLKEQMDIFEGVSTGVAALNLDAEAAKGAFLALGQMASKGTVSAEELRGQLGERIPGAFNLAAKAMGVTEGKLNDMLQKGEIASSVFLPKFAAEMQKAFGAEALKNAKGPQAVQNLWEGAVQKMQNTIGTGLLPIITPILERLTVLATQIIPVISSALDTVAGKLPAISAYFSDILSPVANIQLNLQSWAPYINQFQGYLSTVLGTVKSVLSTVFSVVGQLVEWIMRSQIIKDIFSFLLSFANSVYNSIKDIVDVLKWLFDNVVMPILNNIEKAYRWVRGIPETANSNTLGVATGIVNTFNKQQSQVKQIDDTKRTITESGAGGRSGKGGSSKTANTTGVTHSGAQSIVINFNKSFLEKFEVHTTNVKEGATELEQIVEDGIYRVLHSLKTSN